MCECVVLGKAAKQLAACRNKPFVQVVMSVLGSQQFATILNRTYWARQCLIDLSRPCLHNVALLKSHNIFQLVGKAAPHKLLFSADCSQCFTPIPFISNSDNNWNLLHWNWNRLQTVLCLQLFAYIVSFIILHSYSLAGISWIPYVGSFISWGMHALSGLYPASILACSSQRAGGVNLESFSSNLEVVKHSRKPSK